MLTLYIIGGIASYLCIGSKCAQSQVKDLVEEGRSEDTAIRWGKSVFYFWPVWLVVDLPELAMRNKFRQLKQAKFKQMREDEEVERLLKEENI